MRTNLKPAKTYPFAWLDELVEITLNPAYIQLKALAPKHLEEICGQLPGEVRDIEYSLKAQTFGLNNKTDMQAVVEQYYFAVLEVHRQAVQNLSAYAHHAVLIKTGKTIIAALDEFRQRITLRYQMYLPKQVATDCTTIFPAVIFKLLIKLSGDQIGIVAKAAYQAGLIPAKSLREAFRLLAPHLSTERMETLSDDSMRTHSGQPENPDLDIVIRHLCKVTDIVKGYYRRKR